MFCSNKEHTLLNPGSMLPENTNTTVDSIPVSVIQISPLHITRADVTIKPERDRK